MNWWNLLKFYAADDDWEHFDPDVPDPLDFLAGVAGPHHSPHEQPEVVEDE